jgi:hypothetical protein
MTKTDLFSHISIGFLIPFHLSKLQAIVEFIFRLFRGNCTGGTTAFPRVAWSSGMPQRGGQGNPVDRSEAKSGNCDILVQLEYQGQGT